MVASSRDESQRPFHWVLQTSRCCAVGLITVIAANYFCVAATTDRVPLLSLQGLRKDVSSWWSPSIQQNDRVPRGISVENSLASGVELLATEYDDSSDVGTISVSMISPASLSTSVPGSSATAIRRSAPLVLSDSSAGRNDANRDGLNPELQLGVNADGNAGRLDKGQSKRASRQETTAEPTLKSLLKAGRVGRIQTVNRSLVPWLFQSAQHEERLTLRMSDAAWLDLTQFEIGLRGLPNQQSEDAVASLHRTLLLANSGTQTAQSVPGMRDVCVIASDDANVYFQIIDGRSELIRVLPIDANKVEE